MVKIRKKILIIEDSKDFLFVLQSGLLREGFIVVAVSDGDEGLVAAKMMKPDLILSDIVMPTMDGITMYENIKKAGIEVPIIFLTNLTDVEHIRASLNADIEFDYIIKSDLNIGGVVAAVKRKLKIE